MALAKSTLKRLFSSAFNQIRPYSAPAERSIPPAKQKYVPTTGSYPKGFLAGSAHAGVKPSNTKHDDIALVVSEEPCLATAVFTRNIFKAAPVQFSRDLLKESRPPTEATLRPPRDIMTQSIRGVVVNSGCANAVTGVVGRAHAQRMSAVTDHCFSSESSSKPQTLVMSTGVIGQRLPIDRVEAAIPKAHAALGASHDHWMAATNAICTTDTFPKLLSRTFTLPSHPETEYRIAGMTKGAGMIHPNMGTLLGIVCTDAKIERQSLRRLLVSAVNDSFNSMSIDGDTSTNDTVAFFANGAAAPQNTQAIGIPHSQQSKAQSEDTLAFAKVLKTFTTDLAKLVVRDGEGATKFVTIRVKSDVSMATARRAATSIATSSLVKTALYGKDANWGRILCAIGYAPGIVNNPGLGLGPARTESGYLQKQVVPERTSVSFLPADGSRELELLVRGEPQEVDEERARAILEMEDLEVSVRLEDDWEGAGSRGEGSEKERLVHEAVQWTCDFSHEYVTINGDYRT